MAASRQIRDVLVGFAIPVTALWLLATVAYVITWRPGGEFGSRVEAAAFFAFAAGAVFSFSGLGLALSMFLLSRWVRRLPAPLILGAIGGIALSGMFAGGITAVRLFGRAGLPVTLIAGGALVGLGLSAVAALASRISEPLPD